MTAQELWGEIPDYPNYEASTLGQVRRKGKVKPLKPCVGRNGYLKVSLWVDGVKSDKSLHRLIALTFLENPDDLPEIDHINRVKTDNRVENLKWISRRDNLLNTGLRTDNALGLKD